MYTVVATDNEEKVVQARLKPGNGLYTDFEEWEEQFQHQSEAVRAALRRGVQPDNNSNSVDIATRATGSILIVVMMLLIAQLWVFAGGQVAMLVLVAACIVFGIALSLPIEKWVAKLVGDDSK